MSFRDGAGQQGSFQGYMPRKGPGGRGDTHGSGYLSRNANSTYPEDSRSAGSGHNYHHSGALLRTPPPPSHLYSLVTPQVQALKQQTSIKSQPQVSAQASSTFPYQITLSINTPQAGSLPPVQVQPAGAMLHPDPPPPYTPYPEVPPLSSPLYQMGTTAHSPHELKEREPKNRLPERGKGNRMKCNFSQPTSNLNTSHQFDEEKREQPESAISGSNNAGQRRGRAYRGRGGRFPRGRGIRGKSVSRDERDVLGGSSVRHEGDEFSDTLSSDERNSKDEAFQNRGRGGNKQYGNQRGRGPRRGQSDGINGGGYNNRGGRRKSADETSVSQDKMGNSRDSVNETEAVQELSVQLHFATCFETPSIMKKHIQSALKGLEEANFEFSYEEILLEHKLNKSSCKFTISNCNISSAQKCIDKMVSVLRKTMQISIDANFELLGNGGNVKTKESPESESDRPKKAFLSPSEKEAASPAQETISKRKKKKSRSKTTSTGQENKNIGPISIPTTLCFEVEKSFSLPTGFKTFLRNATSDLGFDFEIDDGTIDLTDKISKCQIKTKSKADARRLKQRFTEFQKHTHLCMTCNVEDKHTHEKEMKTLLDKTKSTMLEKKSKLLQEHEERISQNKEEFKKISSTLPGKEAEINFKAIHDKLSEASKQRDVFMKCFDKLLGKLELFASREDDISQVEHLLNMECSKFSCALPIYAYKDTIVHQVESSQVSIIVGENGCGKSTQIAQYLYDAGYNSPGMIVCTQPSQLTALSLADKVSKERAVKVGGLVGYKTGMAAKVSSSTKILYATDLSLLNEFHEDPDMDRYSCIIVDEAHERSVHTDLLLGMIKSCLPKRPDLKIIIISAPGHQEVFLKYFKNSQELKISGSNFSVDVTFTDDLSRDFEDYEDKAISQALKIHAEESEGDILIFVSLPIETLRCCQEFESRFMGEKKSFLCLPLHSKLPPQELKKVFDKPLNGQRKIIFTTKFAETSLFIESVRYIIDTGVTCETKYDSEQKVNLTTTCPVSQVSAMQRRGCAGHSQGGKCYHLYSRKGFDKLTKTQFPEILRVHLEKAILKLFELNVDLKHYEFVQAPSEMAMDITIDTLTQYGAIDYSRQITKTGKLISTMPFDPKLGFLITEANNIGLLYDATVLAAIVSLGSDLSYRSVSETEADVDARNKKCLGLEKMDSFAWLHVFKLWSKMEKAERSQWCRSKSINYKLFTSVQQYIQEVHEIMTKYFKIEFRHTFSEKDDASVLLKELYMKCMHLSF